MNLEELQSVQSKERRNDTLQHLRDSFYDDVGEYVADLKNRRDLAADRADDPFGSPEVRRLTDEIETAEEVVEKVYERRMGKLVKQASLAAAGMTADTEGMTVQERDLFDEIVESIQGNKRDVLATLSGESVEAPTDPAPEKSPASTETGAVESEVSAASMMTDDGAPERSPAPESSPVPESSPPSPERTPAASESAGADRPSASPDGAAATPGPTGATDGAADLDADPVSEADDEPDRPPTEAHAVLGDDGDEMTDGGATVGATASDDALAGEATTSTSQSTTGGLAGTDGDTARSTVRITDDVGQIFGVDGREYDLERSDVVQLPEQNAEPLLDQDAAERLD